MLQAIDTICAFATSNSKITGDALVGTGINGMTKAELKYTMFGLGYNYYVNDNVKFMVYYNMVTNENAKGITDYLKDVKDNVLTIRMQVRF
jgi:phosphate-selective porin